VGRLNDLLRELAKTMNQKDAFISDAAHQLRNPIAGVLTLAESIERAPTLESAKSRSHDLKEAAREAAHLTNNLLKLERMRAGVEGNKDLFDPFEKLAEVDKAFRSSVTAGVQYSADFCPAPVQLHGNSTMFHEAVKNLLENAKMHGGDQLTLIRLIASVKKDAFLVEVQDDGMGISPSDYQSALGRFSQIGPSAGSGLGLPIAKAVVEDFGGSISLGTDEGGFHVTLSIPLLAIEAPDSALQEECDR
jgi:two-component system sensor histidine kinase TctE